jgi:hypothetical protein
LPNIIEAQAAEIAALQAENQQLRDENARLKGGSGKPNISVVPSLPLSRSYPEAHQLTRKFALLIVYSGRRPVR